MPSTPSSLDSIREFLQLAPNLGTAGQPTAAQFRPIAAAGYQTVINLALPDTTDALPNEADLVKAQGMEYIHIPVVWTAPTWENLQAFFIEMDARKDQKVFVHCARNMRVSAFLFLYRVLRQGADREAARQDLLHIWDPAEYPVWDAFVRSALDQG